MKYILLVASLAALLSACGPDADQLAADARARMDQGKYAEAISLYDAAISRDPKAEYFNARGVAHFQLDQNAKALADFGQAVTLDTTQYKPYYNRGNLYAQRLNDPQAALQDYDRALRLASNQSDIYLNRGLLWYNQGQFERALADFGQARQLAPSDTLLALHLGKTYLRQSNYPAAQVELSLYVRTRPKHAEGYYLLALAEFGLTDNAPGGKGCELALHASNLGFGPAAELYARQCAPKSK